METIAPKDVWSWGAFVFQLPFLLAVKRYAMMWWYLLLLVPVVNILFLILFAVYLGENGRLLAATGGAFANQDEYEGYFKGIDRAGKMIFFACVLIAAIALILLVFGHFVRIIYRAREGVPDREILSEEKKQPSRWAVVFYKAPFLRRFSFPMPPRERARR